MPAAAAAVSAASPTPAAKPADATAAGRATLASNYQTFLRLLTTQLKNQDPTAPLDSNQFTQQLVQYSQVEQQLNTNDLLKSLVANTNTSVSSAVGIIGKDVTATSSTVQIASGKAAWSYNLSQSAGDVKLEVTDANGKVVHAEAPTDTGSGDHVLNWNGKDIGGQQLPDGGAYTLRVVAKDAGGGTVASNVFLRGRVTAVQQGADGKTVVSIAGAKLPLSAITSITEPAAIPTASPTVPA